MAISWWTSVSQLNTQPKGHLTLSNLCLYRIKKCWVKVIYFRSGAGVSNIRPAGHNPARQAFLSGPRGLPEMSNMIDLCLSGVFFQALKYAKTRFLLELCPGPCWGSLWCSPRPSSQLGRATPLPIPFPLDAFWPLTSLKFIHLALRSKRLDTAGLYRMKESWVKVIYFRWKKKSVRYWQMCCNLRKEKDSFFSEIADKIMWVCYRTFSNLVCNSAVVIQSVLSEGGDGCGLFLSYSICFPAYWRSVSDVDCIVNCSVIFTLLWSCQLLEYRHWLCDNSITGCFRVTSTFWVKFCGTPAPAFIEYLMTWTIRWRFWGLFSLAALSHEGPLHTGHIIAVSRRDGLWTRQSEWLSFSSVSESNAFPSCLNGWQ